MTHEAVATENADVSQDLSDEQVDKFFETGEIEGAEDAVQEQGPDETAQEEVREEPKEDQPKVPLAALHEERQRRKELQAQLQENADRVKKMEERFSQVMERLQPQAPSYEDDPIENLKANQEKLGKQLEQHNLTLEQQKQLQAQEAQKQQIVNRYQQYAGIFSQETPDFMDAYNHLMNIRSQELRAMGFPQEQIGEILTNEELGIALKSFEDEVNPAQRIYELAKLRGYRKQQESSKLDQVSKGQQANKSLSGVKGQGKGELSLESLADLPDDEFDQAWDKLFK